MTDANSESLDLMQKRESQIRENAKRLMQSGKELQQFEFEVTCFERSITFIVAKEDLTRSRGIIENCYMNWLEDAKCQCCEEALCNALFDRDILFDYKYGSEQ